jgi:hypothetical protein
MKLLHEYLVSFFSCTFVRVMSHNAPAGISMVVAGIGKGYCHANPESSGVRIDMTSLQREKSGLSVGYSIEE